MTVTFITVADKSLCDSGCGVGFVMAESAIGLNGAVSERRRALILPREHGAWGILLVPLVTGAVVGLQAGGSFYPILLFTFTVVALFWLRTPLESWFGTSPVRAQTSQERQLVRSVILPLAAVVAATLSALFWGGRNRDLLWFGAVVSAAFAGQAVLKKMGRATRMPAQMVGALALTSSAPAAYYVATGRLDATAWALWLTNLLFAGDQIHFVSLRIRAARAASWSEKFAAGQNFFGGQILLVAILGLACYRSLLPAWTWIAFVPVLFRGVAWFWKKPQPIAVRRLGWTEFAHALSFGGILVVVFHFAG